MRRAHCALMIILALLLSGCSGRTQADRAEELLSELRGKYLEMTACSGHVDMTADYGARVYEFGVDLSWQREGETTLTLTAPENVAGVVARIREGETALEFDGVMLETGPLNSTGLSPVDALPALLGYAREGFAAECTLEGTEGAELLRVIFRDPQAQPGEGAEAQMWFDPDTAALTAAELSEGGETVLRCEFSGFTMTVPESGADGSSDPQNNI